MSLVSKRNVWTSAIMLCSALALACGDDKDDGGGGGGGGGGGSTEDWTGTLVQITADNADAPILTAHKVSLLDSDTGKPLDPPVETTTSTSTGRATLPLDRDRNLAIYVEGVGTGPESTYDTVMLNINPDSGDTLLRISTAGTLALAEGTGGFKANQDRAAVTGAVYFAPGGVRKGSIGCVKLIIDGHDDPTEHDFDQRYMGSNPLPTTLDKQSQTSRRGQFYIGNMTVGEHTIEVMLGDELIAESTFFVPFTRAEARSSTKAVLMQLGIDVITTTNPTPADCPALM